MLAIPGVPPKKQKQKNNNNKAIAEMCLRRPLARIHSTNQHTQTQTTKFGLIKETTWLIIWS